MIWKDWNKEERRAAVRIAGLVVGALGIFVLISCLSYLLHWKEDMSVSAQVAGKAGSLGYKTGRFLVCECFGLGSLALLVILFAGSIRLVTGRIRTSLLRICTLSVFGAFFASLLFSFIGLSAGFDTAFGGGLGGRCGAFVTGWSVGAIGYPVTGISILLLIICWMFFCSRRFAQWLGKEPSGSRKKKQTPAEPEPEEPMQTDTDTTDIDEIPEIPPFEPEPIVEHEPIIIEKEPEMPSKPEEAPDSVFTEDGMEVFKGDELIAEGVAQLEPINNRLDPPDGLPKYKFPSIDLLKSYSSNRREVPMDELNRNNNKIRAALGNYRIEVVDVKAVVGPTVTLYKVYPAPGVQIAQIRRLQEDIAMSLNAKGVRVVTLSDSVGIEVANDMPSIVPVKALLNDEAFRNTKAHLPLALGYTITQKVRVFDLADAPHLLVAGATKQGKSVCLNEIITSLLYAKHPSELKFVFIDPKMVEFSSYSRLLKHYLAVLPDAKSEEEEEKEAIVKSSKNAERILKSLTIEMDERYLLLSEANVNNLELYNQKYKDRKLRPDKGHKYLPYIVVVVDEYADLVMSAGAGADTKASARNITNAIIRLAQKGRAAGIHVILATQRPSVDVINGQIKANFPARIAFRVSQRVDSMTILDSPGADKLIGKGDMLFSAGIETERIQCGLVEGDEIEEITKFIGSQTGAMRCYNTPYYLPAVEETSGAGESGAGADMGKFDERFEEAARTIVMLQKGSTSALQTKLGMGFAKAARVMDQLESAGIVGPSISGGKPREVLVRDLDTLDNILALYR